MALLAAFAQTPTGLKPLASAFRNLAVELELSGDPAGAILRWEKVVELEPEWVEGWCRLGNALQLEGRMEEAHRAWRQGPFHPICVEAQGLAWLEEHPEWALQRFEVLASVRSQDPLTDLLLARALARLAPERGQQALERYLQRQGQPSELLLTTTREVASALEGEEALRIVRRVAALNPEMERSLAEQQLELEVEIRAEELMGASPAQLTEAEREQLQRARQRLASGEIRAARAQLEALADQVSRNAEVWAALADVREAQGDIAGAEVALVLARQLAPLSADLHARYSELLATHYGGRFDEEALDAMERALDLGEDAALLDRHAQLALRVGRFESAARSLRRRVELKADAEAAGLLRDLERARPVPPLLPSVPRPEGSSPESWRALHRARVFEERARNTDGSWDPELLRRAVKEAEVAMVEGFPMALNQRAHLHVLQGERSAAIELYRRSLQRDPGQVEVLGRLADLLVSMGDPEAPSMLEKAASMGNGGALVRLAQQDVQAGQLWSAHERLNLYFKTNSSGPVYVEALALRRHLRMLVGGGGALLLVGMGMLLFRRLIRRHQDRLGVGVVEFVEQHPRSLPEVARILSSVRHEVIKHNISSLPELAARVDAGESLPDEGWLEERLYGENGASTRFHDYVSQLEDLAARAGGKLNLLHQDPVFGSAIRAVQRIDQLRGRLDERGVAALAQPAEVLKEEVYDALGSLLRGVCAFRLEERTFEEAWRTVQTERSAGASEVEFSVRGEIGAVMRMPRSDLHDILVNLLRNALDASLEEGRGRIGVEIGQDEDLITGLVRVEIKVCDDVQKRLTTAMIRGRYIDRGLGLAVDLTSRSGGSIHIEACPGWAKAVVLRLPMGEE